MTDFIYANFAQLSYFDWHKLTKQIVSDINLQDRKIKTIFDNEKTFDLIKTPVYSQWDKGNNEYYLKLSEDGHKIYAKNDLRLFMLYSEDKVKPDENPKFPELNEWEFLCAYDHQIILNEGGRIISDKNSGFQGSAFKNGNKVIIAYRGSDDIGDKEHRNSDWIRTNLPLGMNKYVQREQKSN